MPPSTDPYRDRVWETEPSFGAALRDAVHAACAAMAGEQVGTWSDGGWDGGLNLSGLGVPADGARGVMVGAVAPDLETISWDWAETLEGDTLIGTVEVEADIDFDTGVADGVGRVPALLRWRVTADPGQTPELEFDGAQAMPSSQHHE